MICVWWVLSAACCAYTPYDYSHTMLFWWRLLLGVVLPTPCVQLSADVLDTVIGTRSLVTYLPQTTVIITICVGITVQLLTGVVNDASYSQVVPRSPSQVCSHCPDCMTTYTACAQCELLYLTGRGVYTPSPSL